MNAALHVLAAAPANTGRLAGKRVAMVTFSPYPEDPRPSRALDALISEGARVDLICLASKNAPRRETLGNTDVQRVPLKHYRRGKIDYIFRYAAFISISSIILAGRSLKRRYDLVYVHNMPDILVLSSLVPKAFGAKVILDLHDPMPELLMTIFNLDRDCRSVRLIRRIEKWCIARADLVLTVNLAMKRLISSRSCLPEKVGVVMNSPDGKIFSFCLPQTQLFADSSCNRRFVIMYHGSLVERNGLDLAIDAFARVRKFMSAAELRIFGASTPFLERVMSSARSMGLHEGVRYLGPRSLPGVVSEIHDCDLGIIPNLRNAFTEINTPTRIFEYLTLGKPVIAPSTPGIVDYFGYQSLLYFEPGNSSELAEQIQYVFTHPSEVAEIVRKGQQVLLSHTWERERKILLDLVGGIFGGN